MLTSAQDIRIVALAPAGLADGVEDLLHLLGYRSYFPTPRWEIVPEAAVFTVNASRQERPDFYTRQIFYGWGSWRENMARYEVWQRHNRANGFALETGHSYGKIIQRHPAEFREHPEYIIKRTDGGKAPKFDIANPGLRQLVVEDALTRF